MRMPTSLNLTKVTPGGSAQRLSVQRTGIRLTWMTAALLASAILDVFVFRRMIRHDPNNVGLLAPPTLLEWEFVSAIAVVTALTVVFTNFYKRWMFWRKPPKEHALTSIIATLVALYVIVEMFAAVTSVTAQKHMIPMTGPFGRTYGQPAPQHPEGPAEKGHIFEDSAVLLPGDLDVYQTNELFFGWTLLDAVPGLQLPNTLDIKKPDSHPAGWHGGLIVLTFKILVILPILTFARSLYERRDRNTPTSETQATASRPEAAG